MTITTALIGYGVAGRFFHVPLIRATDGLELRVIVQRRGAEGAAEAGVDFVRDAEGVLSDASIALVVIATPSATHFELARRALEAGKHVVVDKPMTVTSQEARQLIEIATERHLLLAPFHNRRWDADFLTVRQLMARGVFGRIVAFESRFDRLRNEPRPDAWREHPLPGSGVLYDLGPHLIDQVLALFGPPARVTASVRTERVFALVDDAFDLWLEYPELLVTVHAGMLERTMRPRFVIRGTKATYVKFGLDPQERALRAGLTPGGPDWGIEPPELAGTLFTDAGEERIESVPGNYLSFYENVRDTIRGEALLAVQPDHALRVIEMIELARAGDSGSGA